MKFFKLLLLSLVIGLTACENLEEKPYSFLSVSNLYQNEQDVDRALLGTYQAMFFDGVTDLWYFLSTSGPSPNVTVRLKPQAQGRMSSVNFNATNPHGSFWGQFYQGINRANTVIENTALAGLDPALESEKIAEARFLRGYYYFQLLHLFGGVPLQLQATQDFSDEAVKKPRATVQETYDVIVEDLTFAAENLPANRPATQFGRAIQGTANAVLGKVYLTMSGTGPLAAGDHYQEAITALERTEGVYSLQDNFADVFTIANEQNSEIIFARPDLSNVQGSGTVLTFFAGAPNSPFAFNGGQYQFAFTERLYNLFDSTDTRRDATFLYSYVNDKGQEITYNSPDNPAGIQFGGPMAPNGIPMAKLKDPSNTLNPFGHGNDLIFLRYADVLLMLAEAYNETGNAGQALDYLNQVRQRAGVEDETDSDAGNLREIIKIERQKELAGEFTEYYDLQRWGDLEASMLENIDSEQLGVSYEPKFELMPIPQGVLETNENLEQNPGY